MMVKVPFRPIAQLDEQVLVIGFMVKPETMNRCLATGRVTFIDAIPNDFPPSCSLVLASIQLDSTTKANLKQAAEEHGIGAVAFVMQLEPVLLPRIGLPYDAGTPTTMTVLAFVKDNLQANADIPREIDRLTGLAQKQKHHFTPADVAGAVSQLLRGRNRRTRGAHGQWKSSGRP